jgi:penicillin-binding protein-related factor A (putative recombinase)
MNCSNLLHSKQAMKHLQKLLSSGPVSYLFEKVSQTQDIRYIEQASDILKTYQTKKKAMEILATV